MAVAFVVIPQGGEYDLTVYQGAIFSVSFQLTEADEVTPIPFEAGTVGFAQIRTKPGGDPLADFDVDVTPGTATVVLSLSSAVTATLTRDGVYDVFLRDSAGDQLFIQGKVTLDQRVTVVA